MFALASWRILQRELLFACPPFARCLVRLRISSGLPRLSRHAFWAFGCPSSIGMPGKRMAACRAPPRPLHKSAHLRWTTRQPSSRRAGPECPTVAGGCQPARVGPADRCGCRLASGLDFSPPKSPELPTLDSTSSLRLEPGVGPVGPGLAAGLHAAFPSSAISAEQAHV